MRCGCENNCGGNDDKYVNYHNDFHVKRREQIKVTENGPFYSQKRHLSS